MTYAEHVDAGRFTEVAAMFGNATYRVEHAGGAPVSSYQGAAEVEAFCAGTRMHDDGTPRTKHVISNVIIELDGDRVARGATRRCSSKPTCCRSNPSLPVATSTGSNALAASGGSLTVSSPGSSSETAASTSSGTRARRRHVVIHPRLSVNSISSYMQPLAADIALWQDLGVERVALILPKIEEVGWDAARDMVTRAGLRVSTIFGPTYRRLDADRDLGWWDADQTGTVDTVEFAASIGAASVYVCTGAAPTLTWDEAADAFGELVAPAVARSAELGVPLLVEPTNPLRSDVSFVFWQRDAMDLARRAGTKVMLDFQSCWYERGLEQVVRENIDLVEVAQISDFVIGTTETGNRVVPGDGDIPLERLVAMALDAGFEGVFDLEVMGPRIEEEGYPSAVRRAVDRASELLDKLGA